ncbi:EAL domain-containing protein [Marinospirillum sp. MEB164]|uniref:EAL domain-containing protein n=1 Tax=Marinospirillum alkalitolerans TaxID=3123374 RepID=A0ABW8PXI7_9GAMM
MQTVWQRSIQKRLSLLILLVTFTTGLLGYGTFLSWTLWTQEQQTRQQASILAQLLSEDFARLILQDDVRVATDIHIKLSSFTLLQAAIIYDRQQRPLFQYLANDSTPALPPASRPQTTSVEASNRLSFYQPLAFGQRPLGEAWLSFHKPSLQERLLKDAPILSGIALGMLLFSYLLASLFAAYFTTPILRLVHFFEQTQDLTRAKERPQWLENNEFGRLYHEINRMLDRIQAAHEDLRVAAVAFETPSGMMITDADQKILRVNQAFTAITGYRFEEVSGATPALLRSGHHAKDFYQKMWQTLQARQRWEGEVWNRHKNGQVYPERLTIQAVLNQQGEVAYYVGSFVDLSALKAAQAEAEYLGFYDPLTGLANRRLMTQRLDDFLNQPTEQCDFAALLCFDLSNFKLINESYGYDIGDQLLKQMARRLRHFWGEEARIGRLGDDLFLTLQEQLGPTLESATLLAKEKAVQLQDFLQAPYQLETRQVHSTVRVGIVLLQDQQQDASELIKQAEIALQQAKLSQEHHPCFFDAQAQHLVHAYLEMQQEMVQALQEQQFELHYQIQCNDQGEITGAEALLRWRHPQKGLISPAEFIPVAERSRLILPLGNWVLHQGCTELALWQQQPACATWMLAVNVSALQFQQDDFVDQVSQCLQATQADPKKLKLELTEAVLVQDLDATIAKMQGLKAMGISLSLDDFGTGYSSLSYLRSLPINQIKIDQTFVRHLKKDSFDAAIVKSVVSLGEAFCLDILAEGVETQEQRDLLQELGCRHFQGYFFSRPLQRQLLYQHHIHPLTPSKP